MKKRKEEITYHVHRPGTLEVLSSLMSEYQWLELLRSKYANHQDLIDLIQQIALGDRHGRLSIKDIANRTNKKPVIVTQAIHSFYEELWTLNEEQPHLFTQPGTRYNLSFKSNYEPTHAYFTLWLPNLLQTGDTFRWPFIQAKQQTYSYYVDDISHDFSAGEQTTMVTLRPGMYNLYRKTLFDKACFLNILTVHDQIELTDYQIDELLVHRVERNRSGYPESLAYLEKRKFKYW